MNERSGGRERNEQSGASERVSDVSERANGRASGPVLTSLFLFVPDHSALVTVRGQLQVNPKAIYHFFSSSPLSMGVEVCTYTARVGKHTFNACANAHVFVSLQLQEAFASFLCLGRKSSSHHF